MVRRVLLPRTPTSKASSPSIRSLSPAPRLSVDAFWLLRGRILLVRRGRPPFKGRWALPGGFVELGESTESAVIRELEEETSLRARPRALVGVYSEPGRDPRGSSVSVVYDMVGRGGTPVGGDDAREAAWVRIGRIPRLAFDHSRIVTEALRQRSRRRRSSGSR